MTSRRDFLIATAASSLLSPGGGATETSGKRLEGVFAIPQTPFTGSGAFDSEALANEIEFLHRMGVQGITWPVNASEWSQLTVDERLAGAETIVRTNRKAEASRRPAVVIAVQSDEVDTAARIARHADKSGADAILAIPYKSAVKTTDDQQMEYYSTIAAASNKPMFVQAIGDMSVDLVLRIAKKNPTIRYVKDEAGNTTARLAEYRRREKILDGVFSGKHGPNFVDDLERGAAGQMPAAGFSDLYVATLQAWKAGKKDLAQESHARTLLLAMHAVNYGVPGQKYMLQLRGVLQNSVCRRDAGAIVFDNDAKKAIETTMNYLKPWLKA